MKAFGIVIGVLVLLFLSVTGLYFGSAWYLGKKIQEETGPVFKNIQSSVNGLGSKWAVKDYHRGLLRSKMKSQIILPTGDSEIPTLEFACETDIVHGPLLGLTVGVFSTDSICRLDSIPPARNESFKGFVALTEHSVFSFNKSLKGTVKSHPFPGAWQNNRDSSFLWKGCRGQFTYLHATHLLNSKSDCGGWEGTLKEGETIVDWQVAEFQVEGQSYYPDLEKGILYSPKNAFTFRVPGTVMFKSGAQTTQFQAVEIGQSMEKIDGLSNIELKVAAQKILLPEVSLGPANLIVSFQRLPTDLEKMAQAGAGTEALTTDLVKALSAQPQVSIDKLRLESGPDFLDFNLKVKLAGATPEDLNNPFNLISKTELAGAIEFTQPFSEKILPYFIKDPVERARFQSEVPQQIMALRQSGFLQEEGAALKSRFKLQQGQLSVNDQALDIPLPSLFGAFGGTQSGMPGMAPSMNPMDPSMPVDPTQPMPPLSTPVPQPVPQGSPVAPPETAPTQQPEATAPPPSSHIPPPQAPQTPTMPPTVEPTTPAPAPAPAPAPKPQTNYFRQDR